MKDKIIIEYSISQKAFHRSTISEMLGRNLGHVISRIQTDYVPVMIFDNIENCDKWLEINGYKLKDYSMYKSLEGETKII